MHIQKRCILLTVFLFVFVSTSVVIADEEAAAAAAATTEDTTATDTSEDTTATIDSSSEGESTTEEEDSTSQQQQEEVAKTDDEAVEETTTEEKGDTTDNKKKKDEQPAINVQKQKRKLAEEKPMVDPAERKKANRAKDEKLDWGTYYDPKSIFCGDYDCYKILGFDYEEFNAKAKSGDRISKSEITKTYRKLSREWHPDKNKGNPKAKERFVKISRAYEVLTNEETRKEYDFMRYNQEAYVGKYGSSVLWNYAPKSDTIFVVVFLLICSTVVSWFAQLNKWQNVANKLVRAAAEDLPNQEGGSDESRKLRQRAVEKLEEDEKNGNGSGEWEKVDKPPKINGSSSSSSLKDAAANKSPNNKTTKETTPMSPTKGSKKINKKQTAKERKKEYNEQLQPIIEGIVHDEMVDFGHGYHKPTFPKDLLVYQMVLVWPKSIASGILWNTKYLINRLLKKELTEDEKTVLTIRAVGDTCWNTQTEEEQKRMLSLELYKTPSALEEWKEEQELKRLPIGMQKRIKKWQKMEGKSGRSGPPPEMFKED